MTWFPALVALGALVLIVLNISGTSSGAEWFALGTGPDPRLLLGTPEGIRSDEWLVQQSWVVSQAAHGYPAVNPTFFGGLDMTVLNELPSWDWSSVFRPHLWGYLFFGLDAGMAWHWWIPAVALVSGCYLFIVALLPRRPLTAAMFAIAIFFTPLLQWWYTPSSVWPVAWAFLAMAAVIWIFKDRRRWVRITWSAVIGYTSVTMAMGLYVPFMLPGIYMVLAFAVGYLLRTRPWRERGIQVFLGNMIPLGIAAIAAVAVVLTWVLTRLSTFIAIASTAYPGHRTQAAGALLKADPYLTGVGGAPWSQALKGAGPSLLGGNSSEGSTVFLLSVFLAPALLWFVVRAYRRNGRIDWLLVTCLACFLMVAAFLLIPGWDALAQLLQLDRVPPERFRIFYVVLLPLFAALTMEHVERYPSRWNWIPGAVSAGFAAAFILVLWRRLATLDPNVLVHARLWIPISIMLVLGTFLLFLRRFTPVAALLLLIATVLTTGNVNPFYRGIYDLRQTQIGKVVESIDSKDGGAWIGVGSYSTWAVLVESGVRSLSGVQTYPPKAMWKKIDPQNRYENEWNRLAHVSWQFGDGEPSMTNPGADVVQVDFDPCSRFAQKNVSYVLADQPTRDLHCLVELDDVQQGTRDMRVYKVVSPG